MKNILFFIVFLILKLSATEPNIDWVKYYGTNLAPADYFLRSANVDDQGNVYGVGTYSNAENSADIHLIKFNSAGDTLWSKNFEYNSKEYDSPVDIQVIDNDEIIVAANIYQENQGKNFALVKYGANGNEIWHYIFNSQNNMDDEISCFRFDEYGNIFLFGTIQNSVNDNDFFVSKIDFNGNLIWKNQYNLVGNNEVMKLGLVANNKVYFTGYQSQYANGSLVVTCLSVDSGNVIWSKKYSKKIENSYRQSENYPTGIKLDNYGNVCLSGVSEWPCAKGNHKEAVLLKYSAAGDSLWKVNYIVSGFHTSGRFNDLVIGSDNSIFLTGSDNNSPFLVFKYDGNGTLIWKKSIAGWASDRGLISDDEGNLYCLATSANQNLAFVKINNSGNLVGTATNTTNQESYGSNIIKKNNDFYISTSTKGSSTAYDYTILKFNNCSFQQEFRYHGNHGISKNVLKLATLSQNESIILSGVSSHISNSSIYTVDINKDGTKKWENIYEFPDGTDIYPSIIVSDVNGNVYITGYKSIQCFILKIKSDGSFDWIKNITQNNASSQDLNEPVDLLINGNQLTLITNFKYFQGKNIGCLYKYDQNGNLLQQRSIDLLPSQSTFIYGALAENDNLFLSLSLRENNSFSTASKSVFMHLNNQFDSLSATYLNTYTSNYNGANRGIIKRQSNGDFLQYFCDQGKSYFIKYDSFGNVKLINEDNIGYAAKMLTDSEDCIYLCSDGVRKYNSDFNILWSIPAAFSSEDITLFGNNFYSTGMSGNSDVFLKKFDTLGVILWDKVYNSNSGLSTVCWGRNVFTGLDNKIYVTFDSWTYSSASYGLMCLSEGTGIENPDFKKPKQIQISNYPNPFNNSTTINYNLPASGSVKLSLINSLGETVKQWQFERLVAGSYSLKLDGVNLASGIYYLQLSQGGITNYHKMLMLK